MAIQDAATQAIRSLQFNKQMRFQADQRDKDRALALTQQGQSAAQAEADRDSLLTRLAERAAMDQQRALLRADAERYKADTALQGRLGGATITANAGITKQNLADNADLQIEAMRQRGMSEREIAEWLARKEIAAGGNRARVNAARAMAGRAPQRDPVLESSLRTSEKAAGEFMEAPALAKPSVLRSERDQGAEQADEATRRAAATFKAARKIAYKRLKMSDADAEAEAQADADELLQQMLAPPQR